MRRPQAEVLEQGDRGATQVYIKLRTRRENLHRSSVRSTSEDSVPEIGCVCPDILYMYPDASRTTASRKDKINRI